MVMTGGVLSMVKLSLSSELVSAAVGVLLGASLAVMRTDVFAVGE